MRRKLLELMGFVAISLLWLAGSGCSNSAVGDPCVPEAVPTEGFLAECWVGLGRTGRTRRK